MRKLLREGLLKHLTINEVVAGNCGSHYTKQFMFEEGENFDPFNHIDGGDEVITEPFDKSEDCVLSFQPGNAKLEWPYFSLPAGYTCPFATVCKSFAAKAGQKFSDGTSIKQGKEAEFRCYAARAQAQYPSANKSAFKNFDLLRDTNKEGGEVAMTQLIIKSFKHAGLEGTKVFRIHESGDFFSANYMKAWFEVAKTFPTTRFYAYTTSLEYWVSNRGSVPSNMKMIASMDKNNTEIIMSNNLRYSVVVYSAEQAGELGLKIDVDDSLAWGTDDNFALLLHGQQPKGSEAAEALKKIKSSGTGDKVKQLYKQNRAAKKDKLSKL
tara:strand:+ start:84 stop:1055 length:972 start_codon:yes stop_codon:yes gene_type:complete